MTPMKTVLPVVEIAGGVTDALVPGYLKYVQMRDWNAKCDDGEKGQTLFDGEK